MAKTWFRLNSFRVIIAVTIRSVKLTVPLCVETRMIYRRED